MNSDTASSSTIPDHYNDSLLNPRERTVAVLFVLVTVGMLLFGWSTIRTIHAEVEMLEAEVSALESDVGGSIDDGDVESALYGYVTGRALDVALDDYATWRDMDYAFDAYSTSDDIDERIEDAIDDLRVDCSIREGLSGRIEMECALSRSRF